MRTADHLMWIFTLQSLLPQYVATYCILPVLRWAINLSMLLKYKNVHSSKTSLNSCYISHYFLFLVGHERLEIYFGSYVSWSGKKIRPEGASTKSAKITYRILCF